jgi:hypothetical protein
MVVDECHLAIAWSDFRPSMFALKSFRSVPGSLIKFIRTITPAFVLTATDFCSTMAPAICNGASQHGAVSTTTFWIGFQDNPKWNDEKRAGVRCVSGNQCQ